jgi:23S rRNA (guanine745-N1)-methyltransferase
MSIDSTWLRCPNCFRELERVDPRILGCDAGHRFDLSKHGTVTLLPPRAPHTTGDGREMLTARADLLGSGVFDPIADELLEACRANEAAPDDLRIADLGCGTGFYSARLADGLPGTRFLLADRSPDAVRLATRALPTATGVVLDLWRPLPIRDGAADICLNVFAPRNPEEFARITRQGGYLLVVVPTERHLAELRARGGMLDIPGGKAEQVTAQFATAGFEPIATRRVEYVVRLDPAEVGALVGMGPSAHHLATGDGEPPSSVDAAHDVTVSVDVLRFRRG